MVIYEVNLTINNNIFEDYYEWLLTHIKEMLTFQGFEHAEIAKEKCISLNDNEKTKITVRYLLKSEKDLNHYLDHHAQAMRDEAIQKFSDQFVASRRVFTEMKTMT